ncbi:MAG: cell division protein FtsQ, partial [Bacteroidales bacterium]|nr:cell division protein FtsQ [Bacteroidales bacterium]
YVNRNQEIDLVPKVGGQIVELGKIEDINDLAQKMFRLRLFYEHAMKGQDWQRYSVLDLRYRNQLVATRRAGYN